MLRSMRVGNSAPLPGTLWLAVAACGLMAPLCGCLVVGGYRSGSGFFLWPGSIVFFLIALFVVFLLRRR